MKDAILMATRSIRPGLLQNTNRRTWPNMISVEGHVVVQRRSQWQGSAPKNYQAFHFQMQTHIKILWSKVQIK
jgi:hypothetical protein